jgi:hypothetical protein
LQDRPEPEGTDNAAFALFLTLAGTDQDADKSVTLPVVN